MERLTEVKEKILIVDDDLNILESLADILFLEGYEVISTDNGQKAIESVKSNNIKIVLMDYKMPGMNGVEIFREIMKINSGLKVIFITACYNEKIMNIALKEGATGILNKPVKVDQLLNIISSLLL